LAVLSIILLICTCRCAKGLSPPGRQYLHMSLMNMPEVRLSLNTPAKLINLYAIFSNDCRVSSLIYLPMIALTISNMVFWQNLYVFYSGGFPYILLSRDR